MQKYTRTLFAYQKNKNGSLIHSLWFSAFMNYLLGPRGRVVLMIDNRSGFMEFLINFSFLLALSR